MSRRRSTEGFFRRIGLDTRRKKIAAVAAVGLLMAVAYYMAMVPRSESLETGKATIDDLLASQSTRNDVGVDLVIVARERPYMTLAATPVALYFEGSERIVVPLLVAGENPETPETGPSKAVQRFADQYAHSSSAEVGGPDSIGASAGPSFDGECPVEVSMDMARFFWASSDGAVLVEPSENGYSKALPIAPLASYLNIPIIITHGSKDAQDILKDLGVKYTIVAGDIDGYKKAWHIGSAEEAQDILAVGVKAGDGSMKSIIGDRLGGNVTYITMANPIDIHVPEVLDEFTEEFTGELTSKGTGSTFLPTKDDPSHVVTIPADWEHAKTIVDSRMPFVQSPDPRRTPEKDGQRSYTYVGRDEDGDGGIDMLHYFSPSLAYESINGEAHGYMEQPMFHMQGEQTVQIAGTLYQQFPANVPNVPNPLPPPTTTYTITVTVQKLSDGIYPFMPYASSMAPYLTAYHGGVILAKPGYGAICDEDLAAMAGEEDPEGCGECYSGMTGPIWDAIINSSNQKAVYVKEELNGLLARLAGLGATEVENGEYRADDVQELAAHYKGMHPAPMLVAVTADTTMVPWYYFGTDVQVYQENEGYGLPSDNMYADIDADPDNPPFEVDGNEPTMELGIGRVIGWDVQDQSALIARTFFYFDIIDTFTDGVKGHTWKDSALTSFGSQPPVEFTLTVSAKLNAAWRQSGFTPHSLSNMALSDSAYLMQYYERSNFIYFCAHGFFYWYIPPGYQKDAVGGGFYVSNVKDVDLGPSVIFGSSCVTGRVDRLDHYNTISQAYIHSGVNAYIGASRLSYGWFSIADGNSGEIYGGYLGLLMYGYMTGYTYDMSGGVLNDDGSDLPIGAALMLAKNDYSAVYGGSEEAHADTLEEFHLFGDPAFNPYEPNHN